MELVKARAYGEFGDERAASAHHALRLALSTMQQLFAPILPFVAEEVWSWWQDGSIHATSWPESAPLRAAAGAVDGGASDVATEALSVVRRVKSEAKRKLRTPVVSATFTASAEQLALLDLVIDDVKAAGNVAAVGEHVVGDGGEITVDAELEAEAEAS